jgi:hypothetical protein
VTVLELFTEVKINGDGKRVPHYPKILISTAPQKLKID